MSSVFREEKMARMKWGIFHILDVSISVISLLFERNPTVREWLRVFVCPFRLNQHWWSNWEINIQPVAKQFPKIYLCSPPAGAQFTFFFFQLFTVQSHPAKLLSPRHFFLSLNKACSVPGLAVWCRASFPRPVCLSVCVALVLALFASWGFCWQRLAAEQWTKARPHIQLFINILWNLLIHKQFINNLEWSFSSDSLHFICHTSSLSLPGSPFIVIHSFMHSL